MNLGRLGIGALTAAMFAMGLWSGIGSADWLSADAKQVGLTGTLGAAQEIPRPKGVSAKAGGRFSGGLTRKGTGATVSWRLTFHGLTGKAAAAHIHLAKPGKAGPVAVALCGPCRSGIRGTARVNARTRAALLGGSAYVNVHTAKNPAGEIRAQILKGGSGLPSPTTTTPTTTPTPTYTDPSYPP